MARRPGAVQREIRQRRPFRSEAEEAVVALIRTADVVRRRLGAVLRPSGITLQQYNVLRILRGAGPKGLQTLAIASRMIERTPGITRLIDRLEAKGWVRRERSREDRREVICRITPAGLQLLETLDPPVIRADAAALGQLGREERGELIRLLDAVRREPPGD